MENIKKIAKAFIYEEDAQVFVEYILILSLMVVIFQWIFSSLKCVSRNVWVKITCAILYPYVLNPGEIPSCNEIDCGF